MPQATDFSQWAKQSWNPEAQIPLFKWLVHARSEEEKNRIHTLGNLVVPRQAALSAFVLGKMLSQT